MGRIFGHVDVDNNWVPTLSFPMHLGLFDPQSEAMGVMGAMLLYYVPDCPQT